MSVDDALSGLRRPPRAPDAPAPADPAPADAAADVPAPAAGPGPVVPGPDAAPAPRRPVAPAPVAARRVRWAPALVVALLAAVALVGLRDAVLGRGEGATSWARALVGGLDGLRPGGWAVPLGAGLVVVGGLVLRRALAARRPTHLALAGHGAAWLRREDVLALARAAAEDVPGVLEVRVTGGPARLRVELTPADPDDPGAGEAVRAAVLLRLAVLTAPPRVDVGVRRDRG